MHFARQSNDLFFSFSSSSSSFLFSTFPTHARIQRVNSADDNPPPRPSPVVLIGFVSAKQRRNFVNISRYVATFLGTTKAAPVFVYLSMGCLRARMLQRCNHTRVTRVTGMEQHASSRSCLSREARRVEASQRHYGQRALQHPGVCFATSGSIVDTPSAFLSGCLKPHSGAV